MCSAHFCPPLLGPHQAASSWQMWTLVCAGVWILWSQVWTHVSTGIWILMVTGVDARVCRYVDPVVTGVDAHVCRYIDPVVTGVDARVCRYIDSVVTGVDARVCRVWILWLQVWTHVCAGCGSCGHRCECTCVQVYRSCGHRCGCRGLEMLSRTLPLVVCSWVLDTDFPRSPPCTVPAQCFHWPLYSDGDA